MRRSLSIYLLIHIVLAGCSPSAPGPAPQAIASSTAVHKPTITVTDLPRITETATPRPEITVPLGPCYQRAQFGDPQDSAYILPFNVGLRTKLHQGYCRFTGTHKNQLAYDFDMEFGAEVIAARSGMVMGYDEHFADDGTASGESEFNYVFIKHEDGTVGFYAHLMQDSVQVDLVEWIEAGQVIALIGMSGMPIYSEPHLHFGVYEWWPPSEGHDVAVNFRNADGPLDGRNGLYNGSWYEALPWVP